MLDSDRPAFDQLPDGTIRTTYDMLLYGFADAEAEPPLRPGSVVRIGPRRYRVLREEPETATVVLVRGGLAWRHWLYYKYRGLIRQLPFWRLRRVVQRPLLRWRWRHWDGRR